MEKEKLSPPNDYKYVDEKALAVINEILASGKGVEIRKRKDGVAILEINSKQKIVLPVNGQEEESDGAMRTCSACSAYFYYVR